MRRKSLENNWRSKKTLAEISDSYRVYYNYIRPHMTLIDVIFK